MKRLPLILSALTTLAAALVLNPAVRAETVVKPAESPAAGVLQRDELLLQLGRKLAAHFNLEGELQLELIRSWTPPSRLATVWDVAVIEFPTVVSSSLLLRCRLVADGVSLGETTFVVRAQLWRDVWAARQPIAIGAAFDPAALEVRRIDALRERDTVSVATGDRSFVFARGVSPGRLLTWRDLSRRPLVKKGELVEVSAVDGRLAVTMKALAMESGAQGDMVTVRNPVSRRDFAALVVDENRVQVRF